MVDFISGGLRPAGTSRKSKVFSDFVVAAAINRPAEVIWQLTDAINQPAEAIWRLSVVKRRQHEAIKQVTDVIRRPHMVKSQQHEAIFQPAEAIWRPTEEIFQAADSIRRPADGFGWPTVLICVNAFRIRAVNDLIAVTRVKLGADGGQIRAQFRGDRNPVCSCVGMEKHTS